MSERNGTPTVPPPGAPAAAGPGATAPVTAELPVPAAARPAAARTPGGQNPAGATAAAEKAPEGDGGPHDDGRPGPADGPADGAGTPAGHSTGPVTARPRVRPRVSGPLTRMGPWAPVAGGLVGVVVGLVATVFLAGAADGLARRMSLVLLVVGLGLTGASTTLLADEVRLSRWRAREAATRPPAWIEASAGLLRGLTPARLLLVVSGFVLFLAAWTAIG